MYGNDFMRYKEVRDALNDEVVDVVNSPSHYKSGGIEAIEGIEASMGPEAFVGYLKGNVMKYMWRYERKGKPVEDLKKARWYLDRLIQKVEGA
tara:strand:+ start:298 stop:576 length:279 start_codon:yes stop_codon:yes gene_type:complete